MKTPVTRLVECLVALAAVLLCPAGIQKAAAQESENPPYLNPQLSPEQRATDLVHRMTLEEKATQMQNNSAAVPRLKIPAYQWWSEALHGVINEGVTEYPEPVGLAATFDAPGIHTMAAQIGVEGRIKHVQNLREGHTGIMGGLDFWSPNLNIFRDPRWGRGQETYGEDPFLTARMGVAYVTGLQGDDPKYYLAIATPKHYAVHSGPEPTRHFADVDVSKHDEVDTYEPAFRAAVVEGKAGSVMCAYNAINGQPACANQYLLQDQLRGKWSFQGYVVSDCDAVRDVAANHRYRPTQAQGAAISVMRGMDNECVTFTSRFGDPVEKAYVDAVQQGYLPESVLNTALIRLFMARIKLGMFDPPEMVPYTKISEKELDSAEHREHALKLANESMVLLKNDGLLPLKSGIKKIAVVGPLADQTRPLIGNYAGQPTHIVSIMEGLKAEFPNASIAYVPGTQFLRTDGTPIPDALLTTPDGKPGLKADYNEGMRRGPGAPKSPSIVSRTEPNVKLAATNLPSEVAGRKTFGVQWSGFLTPNESGDYLLGIRCQGFCRLAVDTKQVAIAFGGGGESASGVGRMRLDKGRKVALEISYGSRDGKAHAELIWTKANNAPSPQAVAAAKNADVVIAVVGITSQLEGEEMPVSEPGFLGGDRTSIDLPQPEEDLVEAVAAAGKPLAVVLMNGSALAVNWINEHANAVLEAWYPGEEGGAAVAETLSGKNNPAGRLPVTFYKGIEQLPNFEDYGMANRTYRYFSDKPLYPFGYGLSYTRFNYSDLSVPAQAIAAGQPMGADVTVMNTGKLAGDEVVQLYLTFPAVKGAPRIALRGFQRIHLDAGASQKVHFDLKPRDLGMVTEDGDPIIAQGDYTISIGGGQPNTTAPLRLGTSTSMASMHCPNSKGEAFMSESSKRIFSRREALRLSASAGMSMMAAERALASDSIKTAVHQEPGNCSTPRSSVAKTQYGKVRGFLDDGVLTFKGVPYGASTAGENRWLPAKPPAPWTDEYPALTYGANCPQTLHPWTSIEQTFLFDWDDGWQSEDMLKLNIWTPSLTDKRPVMFYMHGGGFSFGSSYELPSHEGAQMARHHDVVQVSVNHRLNVLGFFDAAEIGGSAYEDSANVGMTDLVAALKWVHENIGNFGGDPDRVMIYGQSGGGSKVTTLMGMQSAVGLFHRASAQSGGGGNIPNKDQQKELARQVMKELGLAANDMDALQKMEWSKLFAAGNAAAAKINPPGRPMSGPGAPGTPRVGWSPCVDGKIINMRSFFDAAPEVSKNVPMLVGSVTEEGNQMSSRPTEEEWYANLSKAYGAEKATAIVAALKKAYPRKKIQTLSYICSGTPGLNGLGMRNNVLKMARLKYELSAAPVYTYYFTWQTPMLDGVPGAWHTADLQFCFDNTKRCEQGTGNTPEAQALANKMASSWATFAATGNPSIPGLTWAPTDPETNKTMIWDNECRTVDDPDAEARKIILT